MGDEENRKLFVGGTRNADEGQLESYFQNFGQIESVKVIYDRETNRYATGFVLIIKFVSYPKYIFLFQPVMMYGSHCIFIKTLNQSLMLCYRVLIVNLSPHAPA